LKHEYDVLHHLQNLSIAVSAFEILFVDKDQSRESNQENLSTFGDRQRNNSNLFNPFKQKDIFLSLLNIVDGLHKAKVCSPRYQTS